MSTAKFLKDKNNNFKLYFIEDLIPFNWKKKLFHNYEMIAKNHLLLTKIITNTYGLFTGTVFKKLWNDIEKNNCNFLTNIKNEICIVFHGFASRIITMINKNLKDNDKNKIIEIHTNWGLSPHWDKNKPENAIRIGPPGIKYFEGLGIPIEQTRTPVKDKNTDKKKILIMSGGWGIGKNINIISTLIKKHFSIRIAIGDNFKLGSKIIKLFKNEFTNNSLEIYSLTCPTKVLSKHYITDHYINNNKFFPKIVKWDEDMSYLEKNNSSNPVDNLSEFSPFHYLCDKIDFLVTKPGGITLYEAGINKIKTLLLPPLNIQEKWNYNYWLNKNAYKKFSINNIAKINNYNISNELLDKICPKDAIKNLYKIIINNKIK